MQIKSNGHGIEFDIHLQDNDEGGDGSAELFMSQDPFEWLAMTTGMAVKSNAWAGPDHWKYIKPKDTSGLSSVISARCQLLVNRLALSNAVRLSS